MASKLKHVKGTSLQHFSEEKLIKWRKELQDVAKGVAIYRIDVILPDHFPWPFMQAQWLHPLVVRILILWSRSLRRSSKLIISKSN